MENFKYPVNNGKMLYGIYEGCRGLQYNFVSDPYKTKKGYEIITNYEWQTCRDFLHEYFRDNLDTKPSKIGMKRARFILAAGTINKTFEEKMQGGLRVINHYGNIAGIKPSNLKKITFSKCKWQGSYLLWTGSMKWFRCPQLMSFISFIFRIANQDIIEPFSNEKELQKEFSRLRKLIIENSIHEEYVPRNYSDKMRTCCNKFPIIFSNFNKFFPKKPYKKTYLLNAGSWHSDAGIYAMCSGNSGSKYIAKQTDKILGVKSKYFPSLKKKGE